MIGAFSVVPWIIKLHNALNLALGPQMMDDQHHPNQLRVQPHALRTRHRDPQEAVDMLSI